MILERLVVGELQANCYITGCSETKVAVVIDPGDNAEGIYEVLRKNDLDLKYIINTHGHFDHVGGNKRLKELAGGEILVHPDDASLLIDAEEIAIVWGIKAESSEADKFIQEGDVISFGKMRLDVIHTPGHSPGGVCLIGDGYVFSGDTLFAGSVGRTDFPGGSYEKLIDSIRTKLMVLDDSTIVYPGHGPVTTIGEEKRYNPFIM